MSSINTEHRYNGPKYKGKTTVKQVHMLHLFVTLPTGTYSTIVLGFLKGVSHKN